MYKYNKKNKKNNNFNIIWYNKKKISFLYFCIKFIIIIFYIIIIFHKKCSETKDKICQKDPLHNNIGNSNFQYMQEKALNNLRNKYKYFLQNLPIYNHTHQYSNKIFWCWLQGEDNAPKLAKACLKSIKRNLRKKEIIVITENNMNQYVNIPSYIIQKYKNKYISSTHFSDILRLELLVKYGGTWIDSSVLITRYDKLFFNKDLFIFKATEKWAAGSNWFISAEKGNPILRTTLILLYKYWKENNKLYNYFIFHFFFLMSCEKYNNDYKNIPKVLNIPPHILQSELFNPFVIEKYNKILNCAKIHKLTIKKNTNIEKGLIYHHIIEEFT